MKPPGWEYLLFAATLRRRMDALEPAYRDHSVGYAAPGGPRVRWDVAGDYLRDAFATASSLAGNVDRLLSPESQERVFGKEGEPGDAEGIDHLATRVIDVYGALLHWAAELRSAVVPEHFERATEIAISFIELPIEQFRQWVDTVVSEIDRLPALLRQGEPDDGETIVLNLTLTIAMAEGVVDDFNDELERVLDEFPFGE
jgi:hypothetical protein